MAANRSADRPILTLEEALAATENAYTKLVGAPDQGNAEEDEQVIQMMDTYSVVYNACTQKPPFDFSPKMHAQYLALCDKHVAEHVLPALRSGARGEALLRQLLSRWDRHVVVVRRLSRYFNYLDRYYVRRHALPPLHNAGEGCFGTGVRGEPGLERALADAAAELAQRQRGGEQVDAELASKVAEVLELLGLSAPDKQHKAHPAAAAVPE